MKSTIFATRTISPGADAALLLMRLMCGYAFIIHGSGKIQNPFGWMGPDATIPGIFLALAALSEFGGGIALILGIVTRLAAFGIACTMAVAVCMHLFAFGDPLVHGSGGKSAELAGVFFTIALFLMLVGPGRYSLDRKIFGTRN